MRVLVRAVLWNSAIMKIIFSIGFKKQEDFHHGAAMVRLLWIPSGCRAHHCSEYSVSQTSHLSEIPLESWQSHGAIQVSKSKMYIHALLLQKKLQMDFSAPKAPAELPEAPPKSVDNEDLVVEDTSAPNESESFESTQVLPTSSVDGPLFRRKGTRSAGENKQEVRDVEKSKDK